MKVLKLVCVMCVCGACARANTADVVTVTNDGQSRHHATVRSGQTAYDIYCEDYVTEDEKHKTQYEYCTLSAGERLSYQLVREGNLRLMVFMPDRGRWVIQHEEQK